MALLESCLKGRNSTRCPPGNTPKVCTGPSSLSFFSSRLRKHTKNLNDSKFKEWQSKLLDVEVGNAAHVLTAGGLVVQCIGLSYVLAVLLAT